MKFGENLASFLTPEWRTQYVQYDEMKKFLYEAEENAPSAEESNKEILQRYFVKHDEEFFVFCNKELRKINTFYAEKLAEALRRFSEIEIEVANAGVERLQKVVHSNTFRYEHESGASSKSKPVFLPKKNIARNTFNGKKKLKEMRAVVGEFYLSLILIQNYQQLNFTGFRKILKKHDKLWKTTSGVEYRQKKVENAAFYTNKQIDEVIKETETIAIEDLEGGDRSKAMERLRVPPLHEQKKSDTKTSFLWGFFFGLFFILFAIVCIAGYYKGYYQTEYFQQQLAQTTKPSLTTNSSISNIGDKDDGKDTKLAGSVEKSRKALRWQPAVRMYRGMFLIILMIGLLGVNVHGWGNAGVNHVLIFELDPREHLNFVDLLMLSSFLGVVWSLSCVAFLFSNDFNIPVFANPLACGAFFLLFFFNPTRTFHFRARRWLMRILFRILRAPFCAVRFADFWLADQLNSLVVALRDFQYFFCFYCYDWYNEGQEVCRDPRNVVRPLVAFLPAWFRFAQCIRRYHDTKKGFPHLVNAGKYSTSMFVTLISTIYSIYPDSNGLFYVWVASLFVGTIYTLFWDIRMDWGLFSKDAGKNKFLREQIVYEHKIFYYLAILADLIFRLMWTLTVSIGNLGWVHHEFFTFFIAVCEVIRRFIWNFFRLENEHLNNVGEFRAVRDISIKPIIMKDDVKQTMTLEQIMDLEEGPIPQNKAVKYLMNLPKRRTTDANSNKTLRKFSSVLKVI